MNRDINELKIKLEELKIKDGLYDANEVKEIIMNTCIFCNVTDIAQFKHAHVDDENEDFDLYAVQGIIYNLLFAAKLLKIVGIDNNSCIEYLTSIIEFVDDENIIEDERLNHIFKESINNCVDALREEDIL